MSEILIRQAKIEDAEAVTQLARQTFWDAFHAHPKNAPQDTAAYMAEAFSIERITEQLSDPDNIFLIAEINNEPAGYARLVRDSTEDGITAEDPIELNRLYVHQKFLGKGAGPALMDKCFEVGKENGHDVMWLGVWEYNPRAQAFYTKYGFRFVGQHVFQFGSDPQTDLLMQKEI
jgi:ribosomal protein S18 acetylase RimI-like enzyme